MKFRFSNSKMSRPIMGSRGSSKESSSGRSSSRKILDSVSDSSESRSSEGRSSRSRSKSSEGRSSRSIMDNSDDSITIPFHHGDEGEDVTIIPIGEKIMKKGEFKKKGGFKGNLLKKQETVSSGRILFTHGIPHEHTKACLAAFMVWKANNKVNKTYSIDHFDVEVWLANETFKGKVKSNLHFKFDEKGDAFEYKCFESILNGKYSKFLSMIAV